MYYSHDLSSTKGQHLLQAACEGSGHRHRVVPEHAAAHIQARVTHADHLACALPRHA